MVEDERNLTKQSELSIDIPLGVKEGKKLTIKPVVVIAVTLREQTFDAKVKQEFVFTCEHPDSEKGKTIEIKQAAYLKDNKLKFSGLWLNRDEDGSIFKESAMGILMQFKQLSNPKDFVGKIMETAQDKNGYLCFKAY